MNTADIKITINGKPPKDAADELAAVVEKMKAAEVGASIADVRSLILTKVKDCLTRGHVDLVDLGRAADVVKACESFSIGGVGSYRVE